MPRRATLVIPSTPDDVTVHLLGVDRAVLERMVVDNPPDQRSDARWGPGFAPALISACAVDPPLTVGEMNVLRAAWAAADFDALFDTAYAVSDTASVDFSRRMDTDPRFAEEIDYCAPRGIEHCAFLSWCPACQDKALLWSRRQREVCECGVRRSERADPEAFVPDHEICPFCADLEAYRDRGIAKGTRGAKLLMVRREDFMRRAEAGDAS